MNFQRMKEMQAPLTPKEIDEFLRRHGLTRGEMAEAISVTPPAISMWMNERRPCRGTVALLIRLIDEIETHKQNTKASRGSRVIRHPAEGLVPDRSAAESRT